MVITINASQFIMSAFPPHPQTIPLTSAFTGIITTVIIIIIIRLHSKMTNGI